MRRTGGRSPGRTRGRGREAAGAGDSAGGLRRGRSHIPFLRIPFPSSPPTPIWSPLCQIRCHPWRTQRARSAAVIGARRSRFSYGDTSHSSMPPNPARRLNLLRRPPYCLGIGATSPPISLLPKTSFRSTVNFQGTTATHTGDPSPLVPVPRPGL